MARHSIATVLVLTLISTAAHAEPRRGGRGEPDPGAVEASGSSRDGYPYTLSFDPPRALPPSARGSDRVLSRAALGFLRSTDVASLLGLQRTDELELDTVLTNDSGKHVVFDQHARVTGQRVQVLGGSVTVHVDSTGSEVSWISNNLHPNLTLPRGGERIDPEDAVQAALDRYRDLRLPAPEDVPNRDDVRLAVLRSYPESGPRPLPPRARLRATPYADRLVYSMLFERAGAPPFAGYFVLVDALTGEVLRFTDSARDNNAPPPGAPRPNPTLARIGRCLQTDGTGLDRFGLPRPLSTSWVQVGTRAFHESWATVSCWEGVASGIGPGDLRTFHTEPVTDAEILQNHLLFHSDTNEFADPAAVDVHFWSAEMKRFLRDRGIYYRKVRRPNGALIPIRLFSVANAPDPLDPSAPWANAGFLGPKDNVEPAAGNGIYLYGTGDGVETRSFSGPSSIAHEFFHSVTADSLYADASGVITMPGSLSDMNFVDEGVSQGFDMLFAHRVRPIRPAETGPSDVFHLMYDTLLQPYDRERGLPNLEDPADSAIGAVSYAHRVWAGNRNRTGSPEGKAHSNATLVSLPLKLLVTGGENPSFTRGHVPGNEDCYPLGAEDCVIDEDLGFARVTDLLLAAWTSGSLSPDSDAYTVIEALAKTAKQLGPGWGATGTPEDVRHAFSLAGWGRIEEDEPNDAHELRTSSNSERRNLISVGTYEYRSIEGATCCHDETDFFALNEPVRVGDLVEVAIQAKNPGDRFRLRLYRNEPCEFDDDDTDPGDHEVDCARLSQVYPDWDRCDSDAKPSDEDPDVSEPSLTGFVYEHAEFDPCPGGVGGGPSAGADEIFFVGVARPIDAPGGDGEYTLAVQVHRGPDGSIY